MNLDNDFLSMIWFVMTHLVEWIAGLLWVFGTPL